MDNADKAQELQELEISNSLKGRVVIQATEECIDCGVEISSERQIATGGTDMCAPCKEVFELRPFLLQGESVHRDPVHCLLGVQLIKLFDQTGRNDEVFRGKSDCDDFFFVVACAADFPCGRTSHHIHTGKQFVSCLYNG